MKNKFLLAVLISFFSGIIYSQSSGVEIGAIFTINKVDGNNYKHINFPKANFIIKKGGIADYTKIVGKQVEITSIKEQEDGSVIATIALTSKKSFFNSHRYVTVDIRDALNDKELVKI